MPMCFRMLGKSVIKQKWGISSKYPCSESNLKTVVKQLSFAFSSLFTRLPGALLLSQRLMDGMGFRPVQILHIDFYSFAVLISIKFCTKLKFFDREWLLWGHCWTTFVGEKFETFLQEGYETYNHGRSTSHSTGCDADPSKLDRMHHQLYLCIAAAVKTSLCQISLCYMWDCETGNSFRRGYAAVNSTCFPALSTLVLALWTQREEE